MKTDTGYLTLGEVATQLGCQLWQVRRIYERKLLPPPVRIGRNQVVTSADLSAIKAKLRECGWVK